MTIEQIYKILDEISPFSLQASFDNSGLNLGSKDKKIKNIYLTLEVDDTNIESIQEDSLIISHHPLIFKPIKNLITSFYPCNLINKLLQKNCSLISMHTNFDITHLNAYFAKKLGFNNFISEEFKIIEEIDSSFLDLCNKIKANLNLESLKVSKASNHIKRVIITCGSGASSIYEARDKDCVITGDLKYHDGKIASSQGISLIDIEHFESEKYFPYVLNEALQKINIKGIILPSQNPFTRF